MYADIAPCYGTALSCTQLGAQWFRLHLYSRNGSSNYRRHFGTASIFSKVIALRTTRGSVDETASVV
jgi:hypothetical protein